MSMFLKTFYTRLWYERNAVKDVEYFEDVLCAIIETFVWFVVNAHM